MGKVLLLLPIFLSRWKTKKEARECPHASFTNYAVTFLPATSLPNFFLKKGTT
jgi:hypothetical protein